MVIKKGDDIRSSEITDPKHYFNRRLFLKGAVVAATTVATGSLYRILNPPPARSFQGEKLKSVLKPGPDARAQGFVVDEKLTPFVDITNYNNFYEFSTDKRGVAPAAKNFVTRPWTVTVDGLVNKPRTFDLDDLLMLAPAEERIYRHRCVEAWSMVIPWVGFPLYKLLNVVDPNSKARYVAFQTLFDPKRMPNQNTGVLEWPYVEGLRLDEAMHPLTILASGLYGQAMPPQDGAPLKLVVPWKYGYKGIKSIVRISLVESEPPTTWNRYASNEYGFYSNVNPHVDHPRWSQAKERRIGEFDLRDTLMFNGYGEQVAHLYQGMDLKKYY
ncbi:MAG TPA: protein-methionine-sulfoxide reductase catalytic subunit MsrP [Acidobacteriota bacterium]|nr:protein-methionine-sulfoxide reductase catalytic subunit MsrP [Acidobacteriota bacterium]